MNARERVEAEVLDAFENDYEPSPDDVARALIDQDVAGGDYEGCSHELEIAYIEYEALAHEAFR